jgi:hypothetical protein
MKFVLFQKQKLKFDSKCLFGNAKQKMVNLVNLSDYNNCREIGKHHTPKEGGGGSFIYSNNNKMSCVF